MKTALVTGSGGFVGKHLVPKLREVGYEVTECDPATAGWRFEDWVEVLGNARVFDVVIHLAANILDISERLGSHRGMYNDIALDIRMAEFVRTFPPTEAFVYPSSCAVDNPDDPYAFVKITGERLSNECHRAGVPAVILRPFSGYGFGQKLSYPFPAIMRRATSLENPLTVWGSLTTVRDWIHIDDLADAFLWAIREAPRGVPIEIGTGIGTGFGTLARQIAEEVGYDPDILPAIAKPASSPRRVADPAMALANGFETRVGLGEGIRRYLAEAKQAVKS